MLQRVCLSHPPNPSTVWLTCPIGCGKAAHLLLERCVITLAGEDRLASPDADHSLTTEVLSFVDKICTEKVSDSLRPSSTVHNVVNSGYASSRHRSRTHLHHPRKHPITILSNSLRPIDKHSGLPHSEPKRPRQIPLPRLHSNSRHALGLAERVGCRKRVEA